MKRKYFREAFLSFLKLLDLFREVDNSMLTFNCFICGTTVTFFELLYNFLLNNRLLFWLFDHLVWYVLKWKLFWFENFVFFEYSHLFLFYFWESSIIWVFYFHWEVETILSESLLIIFVEHILFFYICAKIVVILVVLVLIVCFSRHPIFLCCLLLWNFCFWVCFWLILNTCA